MEQGNANDTPLAGDTNVVSVEIVNVERNTSRVAMTLYNPFNYVWNNFKVSLNSIDYLFHLRVKVKMLQDFLNGQGKMTKQK